VFLEQISLERNKKVFFASLRMFKERNSKNLKIKGKSQAYFDNCKVGP
jgi:hypothetical protein